MICSRHAHTAQCYYSTSPPTFSINHRQAVRKTVQLFRSSPQKHPSNTIEHPCPVATTPRSWRPSWRDTHRMGDWWGRQQASGGSLHAMRYDLDMETVCETNPAVSVQSYEMKMFLLYMAQLKTKRKERKHVESQIFFPSASSTGSSFCLCSGTVETHRPFISNYHLDSPAGQVRELYSRSVSLFMARIRPKAPSVTQ